MCSIWLLRSLGSLSLYDDCTVYPDDTVRYDYLKMPTMAIEININKLRSREFRTQLSPLRQRQQGAPWRRAEPDGGSQGVLGCAW